jgi:hypothetical protein
LARFKGMNASKYGPHRPDSQTANRDVKNFGRGERQILTWINERFDRRMRHAELGFPVGRLLSAAEVGSVYLDRAGELGLVRVLNFGARCLAQFVCENESGLALDVESDSSRRRSRLSNQVIVQTPTSSAPDRRSPRCSISPPHRSTGSRFDLGSGARGGLRAADTSRGERSVGS